MLKNFLLLFLVMWMGACSGNKQSDEDLRPKLATLKHDVNEKFFGHDGIKKLCETHLGMRYLLEPTIALLALKNRTKQDLKDPKIYEANELKFGAQVRGNYLVDSYVKYIDDDFGYGMFANRDIKNGELIGEYAGLIDNSNKISDHTWSWAYPKDIYKPELNLPDISVDAKRSGNALRFVNHSDKPNTTMNRIFLDGFVRTLYVATSDIRKDEQIFVSYGDAYWKSREKKDPTH